MSRREREALALRREALVARAALQRIEVRERARAATLPVQQLRSLLLRWQPVARPAGVLGAVVILWRLLRRRRRPPAARSTVGWTRWILPAWQAFLAARQLMARVPPAR